MSTQMEMEMKMRNCLSCCVATCSVCLQTQSPY